MNKRLMILSTVAGLAVLPTSVAFAGTNSSDASTGTSSSSQEVWVAKDVTAQDHYQITRNVYDSQGNLIKTMTITPPAGSLVEYNLVPLSQAQAANESYVAETSDQSTLNSELQQLHKTLFNQLNPQTTNSAQTMSAAVMSPDISVGTSTTDTGSFSGAYGYSVDYSISYSKPSSNDLHVSQYKLWQQNGSANSDYEKSIVWGNDNHSFPSSTYVPLGSSNATTYDPDWDNAPGYQFTTNVVGSGLFGTNYSGYDTLS
ncbi:hypothetical protein [Alicyclobacillus fastidiosus]|uniref:Uncharacterized protein n=1 Tax=Alicyclobacillus fastidiosus TaxID=392011 RepID=A0ABV5ALW1_9BACL|nr:hypothetical protein [Alicyclobacillus fastidiosus]WEH09017.1 hypothetical protein PYS47_20395 [Alicyclobacillus fastidiosus]